MGNWLRLSIFNSAFPEYDPNTNSGNAVEIDTEQRIVQQTIWHDAKRPSFRVLPIMELN